MFCILFVLFVLLIIASIIFEYAWWYVAAIVGTVFIIKGIIKFIRSF